MSIDLDSITKELDKTERKTKKGQSYWMGRDIQKILGYDTWENFYNVIQKACMACESAGVESVNQFRDVTNKISAGKGAMINQVDYYLSRYACYLIAMNGDTRKPQIGIAQTYFAVQTRRQELQDKLTTDERRIYLRNRVKNANISLASTAKKAGVQKYGVFQNAGYIGLYEMELDKIKQVKKINKNENILDRMGRTELAANEFRITQTEDKLKRENVNIEQRAIEMHKNVAQAVRHTIKKLGGTMPEDLPAEPNINKLISKNKKETKGIIS